MIRVIPWHDAASWDAFVERASDATVAHRYAWRGAIERAYGHRTVYLAALNGDELRGVLPLVLVRGVVPGRHLVSMPFMDYGGACADGDDKAEAALVEAACALADRERAVLSLRYVRRPDLPLAVSLEKLTMLLALGDSEDALWRRLPSERRNRIRKGQKHGLVAGLHGAEALDDFYTVFAENMRDLGSPVHSRCFFQEVLAALGDDARIILVRWQGRPVGAGMPLIFRGMISMPWVSSLRAHFDRSPNPVLYWELMRWGLATGQRVLDFGRSSQGSGTLEAKRQWGAHPVQLHWLHHPGSGPGGADRHPLAERLWMRLPLALANTVGPWIRRSIPN